MWRNSKSGQKKDAGKRHATNFGAGYIKIEEYHLLRTGLRGRKRLLLVCVAIFLTLLAIGNLILNIFLLAVLGFKPSGLSYMILTSPQKVIFPQSVNVTRTEMMGSVSSYWNTSLAISSSPSLHINAGPVRMEQSSTSSRLINSSQISLDQNSINLKPFEYFSLYDTRGHQVFLINDTMAVFHPAAHDSAVTLSHNLNTSSVNVQNVQTNSIVGDKARLVSLKTASVTSTADINVQSKGDIIVTLGDPNGQFISQSKDGILLKGLPTLQSTHGYHGDVATNYHLCICGNNGKLFRVPKSCSLANELTNPCL